MTLPDIIAVFFLSLALMGLASNSIKSDLEFYVLFVTGVLSGLYLIL